MIKTITREDIKQKYDNRDSIIVVEALPEKYYDSGHLPGAINIPHTEIRENAARLLPDKNASIIVYCANTECRNSSLAARELDELGYLNVFEYVEGKKDWLEAGLPVEKPATDS